MKTETCGWSNREPINIDAINLRFSPIKGKTLARLSTQLTWGSKGKKLKSFKYFGQAYYIFAKQSMNDYRARRENGTDGDNPKNKFPKDGRVILEDPSARKAKLKYTEGPKDKDWMEEKDKNYVFRLESEGRLDELEPDLEEEVPDLYLQVVTRRKAKSELKTPINSIVNSSGSHKADGMRTTSGDLVQIVQKETNLFESSLHPFALANRESYQVPFIKETYYSQSEVFENSRKFEKLIIRVNNNVVEEVDLYYQSSSHAKFYQKDTESKISQFATALELNTSIKKISVRFPTYYASYVPQSDWAVFRRLLLVIKNHFALQFFYWNLMPIDLRFDVYNVMENRSLKSFYISFKSVLNKEKPTELEWKKFQEKFAQSQINELVLDGKSVSTVEPVLPSILNYVYGSNYIKRLIIPVLISDNDKNKFIDVFKSNPQLEYIQLLTSYYNLSAWYDMLSKALTLGNLPCYIAFIGQSTKGYLSESSLEKFIKSFSINHQFLRIDYFYKFNSYNKKWKKGIFIKSVSIKILYDFLSKNKNFYLGVTQIRILGDKGFIRNKPSPEEKSMLNEILKLSEKNYQDFISDLTKRYLQAAIDGNIEMIRSCVKYSRAYSLDIRDSESNTPLMLAVQNLRVEMVRYILAENVDYTLVNKEGCTAYQLIQKISHGTLQQEILEIFEGKKQSKPGEEIILPSESSTVNLENSRVGSQENSRVPKIEVSQVVRQGVDASFLINYNDLSFDQNPIGEGGFGIVFKGQWQHSDVAIKKLKVNTMSNSALAEFKSEASIMSNLHHPHIITFYGICAESSRFCMVMEYMPKGSLYGVLHGGKTLPWDVRIRIALDVSSGLSHLHIKHILHRDIKSLNVLLDENLRAKLTDFGLSTVKSEIMRTSTSTTGIGHVGGTIPWMAPELFQRKTKFSEKTDIYSLGMLFWEIASRKIPFEDAKDVGLLISWIKDGETEEIPQDCPPQFAKVIESCWSRDAEKRQGVDNIAEKLQKIAKTMPSPSESALIGTTATSTSSKNSYSNYESGAVYLDNLSDGALTSYPQTNDKRGQVYKRKVLSESGDNGVVLPGFDRARFTQHDERIRSSSLGNIKPDSSQSTINKVTHTNSMTSFFENKELLTKGDVRPNGPPPLPARPERRKTNIDSGVFRRPN